MNPEKTPEKISLAPLPARRTGIRRRRFEMLSLWYGSERAAAEISQHTGQPQSIDKLVNDVLSHIRRPENGILIQLRSNWAHLVGNAFSRYCEPLRLQDGVLTLKVRHSAMLMEMQYSLDLIQERINRELGSGICKDIRLVVG